MAQQGLRRRGAARDVSLRPAVLSVPTSEVAWLVALPAPEAEAASTPAAAQTTGEVRSPTMIVHGRRDHLIPVRSGGYPAARLVQDWVEYSTI